MKIAVLECARGEYRLEKRAVPYDSAPLFAEFEKRRVPEQEFIYQAFFGEKQSK